MKEKILDFGKILAKSKKILLINHVRMDPDCFGSLSALYYILKKEWFEVKAINDDKIPEDFKFLIDDDFIENNLNLKEYNPDLIISLDAASLDQLWNTYKNNIDIFNNTTFVAIDHHITNPWFWSLNLIDTSSSSTCELLFEILETIWLDKIIDSKIATMLLTWIYTDTNIYYNTNTTPKTLETWAKLMRLWADFRKPIFEFFRKKEFNKTKLWWEVLKDIKITDNWKIVWWIITKELFTKTNTTDKDTSWLINEFLANISWNEVCFILYPLKNWQIKTSFRSSWFDVSKFCQSFGWWWHKQAAWFNSEKTILEVEQEILDKLKKEL